MGMCVVYRVHKRILLDSGFSFVHTQNHTVRRLVMCHIVHGTIYGTYKLWTPTSIVYKILWKVVPRTSRIKNNTCTCKCIKFA